MRTASMPPRMKKAKAVTMKRLPTVLWLTLVSWPQKPGELLQVFSSAARSRSSKSSSASSRLCTRTSPVSLQALQVVEQRLQVFRPEDVRRHAVAGLDLLGVRDPDREMVARVIERARRDGRSARDVRQVGAD